MKIQEWLRNNGGNLELLEEQLGISSTVHEDGRVILNYSQIDSPKDNEIVRECRGLVLDSNDNWNLVACAFKRFFNVGEFPEEFKQFNWDDCVGYHKEDGSLILIYWWNDQLCINTRGSFGDAEVNYSGLTWRDLVFKAIPEEVLTDYFKSAFKNGWTWVCELCSPHNKIVRTYPEPVLYLLSINQNGNEIWDKDAYKLTKDSGVLYPKRFNFKGIEQVEDYIRKQAEGDPTFEGIVLHDGQNRWKIKSPEYLALHRMANNGDPCHPKNILPFILSGELDELFAYFPEVREFVEYMQDEIDKAWTEIDNLWYCFHDEPSQKKFALAVKDSPHSAVLFSARKLGVEPREFFYNLDYLTHMFKRMK